MAIETERFQVAIGGEDDGVVAILLDTATGRSWRATGPAMDTWQPMSFAADAPPAPSPARAKPAAKPKPAGSASAALGGGQRRRAARAP